MDRILIVDDDARIRALLSEWLKESGYEPVEASTGQEAIRSIKLHPPDLVLLDLVLPESTGIAITQALKSEESLYRIPVIILTGMGNARDRLRSLEVGADDFISKPVDRLELMARIRSLLRSKHLSDRLLISYHELDELGSFAETFTSQPVADWSRQDVALSMAKQVLGPPVDRHNHPTMVWGAFDAQESLLGVGLCHHAGKTVQFPSQCNRNHLLDLLSKFQRGPDVFISKDPPPPELCAILGVPPSVMLTNFVAMVSDRNIVLVAGYPWEVGTYEVPLLRALIRHWKVFERIRTEARETQEAFYYTLETLAIAAEFYDPDTAVHIRRVSSYSEVLATAFGCEPRFAQQLRRCSVTHDVGKATIPAQLLKKSGPLNDAERLLMNDHTVNGATLLGGAPQLVMARNIARSHHENYDGSGYPDKLAGVDIPLEARIVKVVDLYDALRSRRAYKPSQTHDQVLHIMRQGDDRVRPAHMDPKVLEAFLDVHAEICGIFDATEEQLSPQSSHE
jgi:response regulator RpfG family c-di-GMP phosphodiesterase